MLIQLSSVLYFSPMIAIKTLFSVVIVFQTSDPLSVEPDALEGKSVFVRPF